MGAGVLVGIFVGGASTRMGGRPKGLLRTAAGDTIVGRWKGLLEGLALPCVLVGGGDEYEGHGLVKVEDAERGIGPLGGLLALLERAGDGHAVAVACDMPHVPGALVTRLVHAPPARAVAPRRDGRWEPFFARFDAAPALAIARARAALGRTSLQGLFDALGAVELPLSAAEAASLADWDSPEDVG